MFSDRSDPLNNITAGHDIALIELRQPVNFSPTVSFLRWFSTFWDGSKLSKIVLSFLRWFPAFSDGFGLSQMVLNFLRMFSTF